MKRPYSPHLSFVSRGVHTLNKIYIVSSYHPETAGDLSTNPEDTGLEAEVEKMSLTDTNITLLQLVEQMDQMNFRMSSMEETQLRILNKVSPFRTGEYINI